MGSATFQRHLIHRCTIESPTKVQDAAGAETDSWSTAGTDVPCRYVERGEREAQPAFSRQVLFEHALILNDDTTIDLDYRVTAIVRADTGGTVEPGPMFVTSRLGRNSSKPHHITVKLERATRRPT